MTTTIEATQIAAQRAKRLNDIIDGYEVSEDGLPDATVPGAAAPYHGLKGQLLDHPRFVLVTQYGDKGNYRLRLGADLRNIERLAADAVTDSEGGELVYCYFDLDELAGEEPRPSEGDTVEYEDKQWIVNGSETDTFDGVAFENLYLVEPGSNREWGDWDEKVDEARVTLIKSEIPDERMPVRYGLARVVTQVVFNTVPTP
jgi:hypothetical protein